MGKTEGVKRFKISRLKFSLIINSFSADITALSCSQVAGLNRKTVDRYYNFFRHLILLDDNQERTNFKIDKGENGEIDESYFGPHRVRGKRGRGASRKIAVVGILKRGDRVYLKEVDNCTRDILLPILFEKIRPGSDIYTDGWKSYDALAFYGVSHKTVDHGNDEFVKDKETHINGIESCWSFTKRRLAKFNGIKNSEFQLHLRESEWRFNHRGKIKQRLRKLIHNYLKKRKDL